MPEADNYQIVNAINKERKLAAIRAELLTLPSERALDLILDSKFPATLVQSFPEQDLHFLMNQIGEEDFLPVLSLASSKQWEYLLDVEVWRDDRLSMVDMTRNLSLLYRADPERFLRWAIREKTEFIEYYLFRNMEIRIREHDEDPSDFGDEFSTIDSVFYFRFRNLSQSLDGSIVESEESDILDESQDGMISDSEDSMVAEEEDEDSETMSPETTETLITDMLNTLADMDMSVFQGLLLETDSVIPAETEEEEFRLKNVRLAEKGFLPPHEAVAIYQPLSIDNLRERPALFFKNPFLDSDLPLPPRYPSLMLKRDALSDNTSVTHRDSVMEHHSVKSRDSIFVSSLDLLDRDENIALNIQSEFASLVNSLVSADKEMVRSTDALQKIVERACCYLDLGIKMIHSDAPTPESGAEILRKYAVKDLFRVGSGAGMALKERAHSWYGKSYIVREGFALTFLGERWLGIVGGLLLRRPMFFDNYTTGVLYRPFFSLEEIEQTSNALRSVAEVDRMVEQLNPDPSLISRRFLTWKSLFLTLWAMKRMGLGNSSGYHIPLERFKPFFVQLLNLKGEKPDTCGKIDQVIRDDFFTWLVEEKIVQGGSESGIINEAGDSGAARQSGQEDLMSGGAATSATARRIFAQVFDELEQEYGTVSSEDIDPELIYQFIITQ